VVIKTWVFWDIRRVCHVKLNDVSKKHAASIFKVEEYTKQENGKHNLVPVSRWMFS
jgi:hypothetical protein